MYVCRREDICSVCLCVCKNIGMILEFLLPTHKELGGSFRIRHHIMKVVLKNKTSTEYQHVLLVKERSIDQKTMGKIFFNIQISLLQDLSKVSVVDVRVGL